MPRFVKGKSGNPGGKKPTPPDIAELKKLTQHQFQRLLFKFVNLEMADLQAKLKDPKTPLLEIMISRVILKACAEGDQRRLDFILDRMIGKVVEKLDVTAPTPYIIKRTNGEVYELGARQKTLEAELKDDP